MDTMSAKSQQMVLHTDEHGASVGMLEEIYGQAEWAAVAESEIVQAVELVEAAAVALAD